MTNVTVKDAKKIYIETGRLNRNIINKEISISWYKCKLQNLNPKDRFKQSVDKPTISYDPKFMSYIESVVPLHYDYILVNMSLQKCSSRMALSNFEEMDTIDDLAIGTNGGYLTYKTQTNQLVSLDEHYLDCLSNYFSYGIVISQGEKMLGVLMLLSTEKPNDYDIVKIREKLIQYSVKSEPALSEGLSIASTFRTVRQLFAYPETYMDTFENHIEKYRTNMLPILICGSAGSGKSTLALLIAEKKSNVPFIISLNETSRTFQKQRLENAMSHFETVIVEQLECADPEVISVLTVYTEEFLLNKFHEKHSNYKCSKLILTTAYDSKFNSKISLSRLQEKQLVKFIDRLKLNTVNLLNTNDFETSIDALSDALLGRNEVRSTDAYRAKLIAYLCEHSFKEAQRMVEISIDDAQQAGSIILEVFPVSMTETLMNLEQNEKEYILKIYDLLDKNMSATANILNIGRSTLYRKLDKYQNDTLMK